ncbi:hypothetical protein [Carp edema virus]|nr:hypothetical protein [Carp edema virus]
MSVVIAKTAVRDEATPNELLSTKIYRSKIKNVVDFFPEDYLSRDFFNFIMSTPIMIANLTFQPKLDKNVLRPLLQPYKLPAPINFNGVLPGIRDREIASVLDVLEFKYNTYLFTYLKTLLLNSLHDDRLKDTKNKIMFDLNTISSFVKELINTGTEDTIAEGIYMLIDVYIVLHCYLQLLDTYLVNIIKLIGILKNPNSAIVKLTALFGL